MSSKVVRGCMRPAFSWPIGKVSGARTGEGRAAGAGASADGAGGRRDGGGDFIVAQKGGQAAAQAARLRRLAHGWPRRLRCAGGG